MTVQAMAERTKGNKQYPSTQMLWKNETLPPSNFAFIVTTAAPHHVTMNTAPNTKPLSSDAVREGFSLVAGEL